MEPKKTNRSQQQQQQQPKQPPNKESLINFVGDIKGEIRKVSWTDKEELKAYSKIVVGATFFFGIGIFLIDLVIKTSLDGLANIVRIFIG